jgi:hypothetical protein
MRHLFRKPWVARDRDGRFVLQLPDGVGQVLVHLGDELRELLESDHHAVQRVFPVAYPDDPEREAGYQALIRGELIDRHRAGLDLIAATVDADHLTEDQLGAWLTAVNALRLMLGTSLGIDSDDDEVDLHPDDPRAPIAELYHLLAVLLDDIVAALSDRG